MECGAHATGNDHREDTNLSHQISRGRVGGPSFVPTTEPNGHSPLIADILRSGDEHEDNQDHFGERMVLALVSSGALAQQALTGSITKLDESNGKITIQQTQSGTVGANTGGAAEDFKVQDGLIFNAFQLGDKVVFTATDVGGVKTITKLQRQ